MIFDIWKSKLIPSPDTLSSHNSWWLVFPEGVTTKLEAQRHQCLSGYISHTISLPKWNENHQYKQQQRRKNVDMKTETKVNNAQQMYCAQVYDFTSKQVLHCWSLGVSKFCESRDLLFLLVCDSYTSYFVIAFRKSNCSFGRSSFTSE